MHVVLIRHAEAGERDAFARTGAPDSERPVTAKGKKQMRRAARGLHKLVPAIDRLATSPYRRAAQTSRIVARAYDDLPPVVVEQLVPNVAPSLVARWLRAQRGADTIALVGHEPQLSGLATVLVTASSEPILTLEKGAACAIDLPASRRAGTLLWLLTARQLRALGKRPRSSTG
ncbi:MAG TPA: histidine phosphatase family protein [Gemmatimonadaceae bacterium]|nr:histidine phosphatase family protein [Gemmatimonadaceae bacterium]